MFYENSWRRLTFMVMPSHVPVEVPRILCISISLFFFSFPDTPLLSLNVFLFFSFSPPVTRSRRYPPFERLSFAYILFFSELQGCSHPGISDFKHGEPDQKIASTKHETIGYANQEQETGYPFLILDVQDSATLHRVSIEFLKGAWNNFFSLFEHYTRGGCEGLVKLIAGLFLNLIWAVFWSKDNKNIQHKRTELGSLVLV